MSSGEIDENSFINDNSLLYEIRHYLTQSEKDAFMEWRRQFRNTRAKIAVDRRINRMESGNFGDHRFFRDRVWELRIDVGPGYRVYSAIAGVRVVLLLSGGDKRTLDAATQPRQPWCWRGGYETTAVKPMAAAFDFAAETWLP